MLFQFAHAPPLMMLLHMFRKAPLHLELSGGNLHFFCSIFACVELLCVAVALLKSCHTLSNLVYKKDGYYCFLSYCRLFFVFIVIPVAVSLYDRCSVSL